MFACFPFVRRCCREVLNEIVVYFKKIITVCASENLGLGINT